MQTENRLLDDLSRVATGAFSALSGVREEMENRVREQMEKLLSRLDLVTREEFEAVQAMAARARADQEALALRVSALESQRVEQVGTLAAPKAATAKARATRLKVAPDGA